MPLLRNFNDVLLEGSPTPIFETEALSAEVASGC